MNVKIKFRGIKKPHKFYEAFIYSLKKIIYSVHEFASTYLSK